MREKLVVMMNSHFTPHYSGGPMSVDVPLTMAEIYKGIHFDEPLQEIPFP